MNNIHLIFFIYLNLNQWEKRVVFRKNVKEKKENEDLLFDLNLTSEEKVTMYLFFFFNKEIWTKKFRKINRSIVNNKKL